MQVELLGAFVAQDFFGPHWPGGWLCRSFEGWGFGVSDGASGFNELRASRRPLWNFIP